MQNVLQPAEPAVNDKPKRRWYQFSLLSMLVVLTLVGLILALAAREREECRKGERALEVLGQRLLIESAEDFGLEVDGRTEFERPTWLKPLLGDDHFRQISFAQITVWSGDDMRHVANLSKLRGLDLVAADDPDESEITNDDFVALRAMRSLKSLNIIDRNVPGELVDTLAECRQITDLSFQLCDFTGNGVSRLSALSHTKKLGLYLTNIEDDDLLAISSLESLEELDLSDTSISDAGLAALSRLKNLRRLDLSSTDVSGQGLTELTKLPQLEWLLLDRCSLNEDGIRAVSRLQRLRKLSLDYASVPDSAIQTLKKALPNTAINNLKKKQ